MPTGFHPNPHFFSAHLELTVGLLRFLAVPHFPLVPFTTVRIDKRNLLEARLIVTTYNDHVRLLSPEPWLASATKVYSGVGADIVMESLHQQPPLASFSPAHFRLTRSAAQAPSSFSDERARGPRPEGSNLGVEPFFPSPHPTRQTGAGENTLDENTDQGER